MQGYFDIHCHILPGIDDGPKSFEEAIRMILIAYEEGIRFIVAASHYEAGTERVPNNQILKVYNELNQSIAEAGIKISIILANELLYCADTIDALDKGEALTIDETRYILIEFLQTASYREIWKGLNQCIYGGYIPILAHAESYKCLAGEPELIKELINLGTYIQINISSIKGKLFDKRAHFCHVLLKKGWVHFLGTDSLNSYRKKPKVKNCIKYLRRRFGEDYVKQLFWDNPMTMLENKHL